MSMIEDLMKLDRGLLETVPTKTHRAKALSRIMGKPVEVTVKALPGAQYSSLASGARGKSGEVQMDRLYDIQAIIVAAGCVEPDLKDKGLQEHFGAKTPADLAKKLFPGELVSLSESIRKLSGFLTPDEANDEESTKN